MDDKAKRIESLTKKVSENLSQQRSQRQGEIDERGRIMPQARHLEEAVLGAIMLEKESFDVVSGILKEESFYIDAHQRIYKGMRQCYEENQPIDILTVVEQVKLNGDLETVGGQAHHNSAAAKEQNPAGHYTFGSYIATRGNNINHGGQWPHCICHII